MWALLRYSANCHIGSTDHYGNTCIMGSNFLACELCMDSYYSTVMVYPRICSKMWHRVHLNSCYQHAPFTFYRAVPWQSLCFTIQQLRKWWASYTAIKFAAWNDLKASMFTFKVTKVIDPSPPTSPQFIHEQGPDSSLMSFWHFFAIDQVWRLDMRSPWAHNKDMCWWNETNIHQGIGVTLKGGLDVFGLG